MPGCLFELLPYRWELTKVAVGVGFLRMCLDDRLFFCLGVGHLYVAQDYLFHIDLKPCSDKLLDILDGLPYAHAVELSMVRVVGVGVGHDAYGVRANGLQYRDLALAP